jgi:adenosine deaminase
LYTSFAAAKRTPLVVGVNIVGPENGYVAMRDYALHMKMFAFLKKQFPDVNVALHAGELAMGMVPPEGLRSHIHEAVQIAGANRIGHGVDIVHESNPHELLQLMKQRAVALEVNLTSNAFILGIKGEEHPVRLYERYGVPIVISTDDAGVSRINLSHEYLLYTSRYKPSYDRLKQVVYNSIRYSFLPEKEKRHELTKLDQRFIAFEANIAQQVRLGYSPR